MKKTLALIAALYMIAAASQSFAQNTRIATTITTQEHDPTFALGRDFWFAPGQDYVDEAGKYIRLYITSPSNTKAYIEFNGTTSSVSVASYGMATFSAPLSWEMKSSGIVESKGIHVYSLDADIAVYFMVHGTEGGDGAYCIPTAGWGTDYVVASYESLFESFGNYVYDFSSEFTITANQDNTTVQITPTTDLRKSSLYPANNTVVAFPKGQQFSVTLDRGQSVQYQAVKAQDADNYDVTGTVIHASNPVGVVGASMCSNIPSNFSYCEYITDMIPPTRSWGKTYYAVNSAQPQGMAGHDAAMYLMISSVPNQVIYRYDNQTGPHIEATLGPAYDKYFNEESGANKFYSASPFLLVQYMNSTSYPDNKNGNGNPSEVVIPAVENFGKTTLFVLPSSVQPQEPYDNYANIIVRANDDANVTFDGHDIRVYTHLSIDDTFEIYIIPHISGGAHPIMSDSGVGVYVYGYGDNESFSDGASTKVGTTFTTDTTPPIAIVSSQCFNSTVHITDSGSAATTLDEIRLDSNVNMTYKPDTSWIDGSGLDTTGYSLSVIDETKRAVLQISAFDYAGNRTTISSIYTPNTANIGPPVQNFGVAVKTGPRIVAYDTLINSGKVPFKIETLRLLYGNKGFKIDSADVSDSLKVDERRLIKISFLSIQPQASVDTVVFGDECITETAALLGFSGASDFYVSDVNWPNSPIKPVPAGSWVMKAALIHNLSKTAIHVSFVGLTDAQDFKLVPGSTFPIALSPYGTSGDTASAFFFFEPTVIGRAAAQASWSAPEVLNSDSTISIRFDSLIGNAIAPVLAFTADTVVNLECIDTSIHSVRLAFVLSNSGTQAAVITTASVTNSGQFTNLTGRDQHGVSWDPSKQEENLPAGAVDTFTVDFAFAPFTNTSGTTKIVVMGLGGEIGDTLTGTVNVNNLYADVSAQSLDFGTVPVNSTTVTRTFTITDTSAGNLIMDGIDLIPGGRFNSSYSITGLPTFPDTLTKGQSITVNVTFDPSVSSNPEQSTTLLFSWDACNPYMFVLNAALSGSSVAEEIAPPNLASIIELEDGQSIRVIIPSDWPPPMRLDIYNILGVKVYNSFFDATTTFDLGELPRGVYFYRLREGEASQTGKILLGQ